MKKPGLKKRRPPGGGAAGRAYQFEQQRAVEAEPVAPPGKEPTSEKPATQRVRPKKQANKATVPKKPK